MVAQLNSTKDIEELYSILSNVLQLLRKADDELILPSRKNFPTKFAFSNLDKFTPAVPSDSVVEFKLIFLFFIYFFIFFIFLLFFFFYFCVALSINNLYLMPIN